MYKYFVEVQFTDVDWCCCKWGEEHNSAFRTQKHSQSGRHEFWFRKSFLSLAEWCFLHLGPKPSFGSHPVKPTKLAASPTQWMTEDLAAWKNPPEKRSEDVHYGDNKIQWPVPQGRWFRITELRCHVGNAISWWILQCLTGQRRTRMIPLFSGKIAFAELRAKERKGITYNSRQTRKDGWNLCWLNAKRGSSTSGFQPFRMLFQKADNLVFKGFFFEQIVCFQLMPSHSVPSHPVFTRERMCFRL